MPSPYDYMQNRWLEWHEIPLMEPKFLEQPDPSTVAISKAISEEREQCCKDTCRYCADGSRPERSENGQWWHTIDIWCQCRAHAICERAWQEGIKHDEPGDR
jgi:hypothetical protein